MIHWSAYSQPTKILWHKANLCRVMSFPFSSKILPGRWRYCDSDGGLYRLV